MLGHQITSDTACSRQRSRSTFCSYAFDAAFFFPWVNVKSYYAPLLVTLALFSAIRLRLKPVEENAASPSHLEPEGLALLEPVREIAPQIQEQSIC